MRVFVTGASGLIGAQVCRRLVARGDEVVALSRRPQRTPGDGGARLRWLTGDPASPGSWERELDGMNAVIHLAGEPIAGGRWTRARKQRLVWSRVESTRRIAEALIRCRRPPAVLLCASACGFYGSRGDEILDESSPAGADFLASLCADWEKAAEAASGAGIRVVRLRFGIVLSARGGALPPLAFPFRLGLGGPLGPAERWFPWIHERDATQLVCFALDRELRGPMNLVAPEPVTMRDFARSLGRTLGRPVWLPVPISLAGLALGQELAEAMVPGQRIIPRVVLDSDYRFRLPRLAEALEACLGSAGSSPGKVSR